MLVAPLFFDKLNLHAALRQRWGPTPLRKSASDAFSEVGALGSIVSPFRDQLPQASPEPRTGQTVRHDQAVNLLRAALTGFEAWDMALHAAAARRRMGQLLGSKEGQNLIEAADTWMRSQDVRNPELLTGLFTPGFD